MLALTVSAIFVFPQCSESLIQPIHVHVGMVNAVWKLKERHLSNWNWWIWLGTFPLTSTVLKQQWTVCAHPVSNISSKAASTFFILIYFPASPGDDNPSEEPVHKPQDRTTQQDTDGARCFSMAGEGRGSQREWSESSIPVKSGGHRVKIVKDFMLSVSAVGTWEIYSHWDLKDMLH